MTISRRKFCGALGASFATANANLLAADIGLDPLRVIAYYIYGLTGWPECAAGD